MISYPRSLSLFLNFSVSSLSFIFSCFSNWHSTSVFYKLVFIKLFLSISFLVEISSFSFPSSNSFFSWVKFCIYFTASLSLGCSSLLSSWAYNNSYSRIDILTVWSSFPERSMSNCASRSVIRPFALFSSSCVKSKRVVLFLNESNSFVWSCNSY